MKPPTTPIVRWRNGRLVPTSKDSRFQKEDWVTGVVAESPSEGCRDWPWALTRKGYGTVRWAGRIQKVGHVVLELSGRERPPGTMMLHSCDRPQCAAPWHLRWGTALDNRHDSSERGRDRPARGVRNGLAKLDDDKVRTIRAAVGIPDHVLAAQYGVSKTVVGRARRRETWRHVA